MYYKSRMTKQDRIDKLLRDKEFVEFELEVAASPEWKMEDFRQELIYINMRLEELEA